MTVVYHVGTHNETQQQNVTNSAHLKLKMEVNRMSLDSAIYQSNNQKII